MLIQVSSPRPIFSLEKHPQHVVLHTLQMSGVSSGSVLINMNVNVETGERVTTEVEPYQVFPIETGMAALEYYLPFDVIFGTRQMTAVPTGTSNALVSRLQPEGGFRPRDTMMALLVASGVSIIARSAHRTFSNQYEERVLNFQLHFPVTGGGIVRVADSFFDILNPTFNPKALLPEPQAEPDPTLLNAFRRTHYGLGPSAAKKKAERLAQLESSLKRLPGKDEE